MAIKRGPDGVPIDIPSVLHKSVKPPSANPGASSSDVGENKTIPVQNELKKRSLFPDDPPTVPAGFDKNQGTNEPSKASISIDDPKTVIAGAPKRHNEGGIADQAAAPVAIVASTNAMNDPVVGWLVVIGGPGKGMYVKLGNGQNSIGRSSSQRICLNFGDDQISREGHAVVTFDPRGKKFFVQQGSGTNLAYLNESPVLTPTELPSMSKITLGDTTLIFVPLVGEAFNWD